MNKADYAASLKPKMNCCQAVLLAYADELGLPPDTLMRLGSAFGSGMATMGGHLRRARRRGDGARTARKAACARRRKTAVHRI